MSIHLGYIKVNARTYNRKHSTSSTYRGRGTKIDIRACALIILIQIIRPDMIWT